MNQEKPFLWLARIDYHDPDTESEWNHFYSSIHLDEILSLPGVVGVSRYECVRGRKNNPKYMSVTEISGEDNLQKFATSPESMAVGKVLPEKYPKTSIISLAAYRHMITEKKIK